MRSLKYASLIFLLSCQSSSKENQQSYTQILATGTLTENKYSNDYFNLSVLTPTNWIVLNKEEIEARNKMGQELLSESIDAVNTDENKKPQFLININKYRQDAPEAWTGNAGFQISFLKREYFPDDTEISFLHKAKEILAASPLYKNISDIGTTQIGGQTFITFTSELHLKGFVVYQQSSVIDLNNCFLFIDTSYRGDSVKSELDNVIKSVSFK